MKRILKYPLDEYHTRYDIRMPKDSIILCVQLQNNIPTIWALVDGNSHVSIIRTFAIYGTGWLIEGPVGTYVGTYQNGGFVWHVFELDND